jgi:hypothetical protein
MSTATIPMPAGAVSADGAPAAPISAPYTSATPIPGLPPSPGASAARGRGSVPMPAGAVAAGEELPKIDENSSDLPLTSYSAATHAGLNSIAKETIGAIKGAVSTVSPIPKDDDEKMALATAGVGGMYAYRLIHGLRELGAAALRPHEIAAAIHDINNSDDPLGTYLKIFQKTAAQGAGQALTALATEGAIKGVGEIAPVVRASGEAARNATDAVADTAREVVQGERVAQAPAQAALRSVAGTEEARLGESLTKPIETAKTAKDALYQQVGDANEMLKPKIASLQKIEQKLDDFIHEEEPTRIQSDEMVQLEAERDQIRKEVESEGGDAAKLMKQANNSYKQFRSQQAIEKKIFKNPSVVSGDVKYGTPETVNVDAAINNLRRLQTTRYGDQVTMAFGQEGAEELFGKLYEAQRLGVHAMKAQRVAKWIAGIVGASAGVKAVSLLIQ